MPQKKLRRTKSTEEAALTGLRAALERYPSMSRGAFARATGVDPNTIYKWLRGDLPQGRYIEIIHDFIEGRLVPRELGPNEWTLEPAAARQADYQELLLALGEIAAGSATLWVSGTRITIDRSGPVQKKEQDALDGGKYRGDDASMNTIAQPPRAPPVMATFKLYDDDRELLARVASHLGTTKTDVLRRAMRLLAKVENVPV